ncbi:MAG: ABC transporter substrate-binding protein [Bacillota bacterium]|nr:ABC transporter substrate-binding protein [Bacillota bacterium]
MKRSRWFALVVAMVVVAMIAAGCAPQATPPKTEPKPATPPAPPKEEPKYGGTFIVAQYSDITNLCPFLSTDGASNVVNTIIHRPLVQYRYNNVPTPVMAESWSFSTDGLTWTFKLRKGIKWHDGTEFTAEDVKFTYETILDPKTKSVRAGDLAPVKKIETPDPYTVVLTTEKPYAPLIDKVATLPIVSKKHIEKIGGLENYNKNPLGTGPFKFKERVPEEKVVLVRFDDYFEGKPYLDEIVFKAIPEPSVRMMALDSGEAHWNWWAVPEEDIPRLKADSKFTVLQTLRTDFHFFGINHFKPFFKDVKVRQAFVYATDKESIVKNLATYTGIVAHGPYSDGYGDYVNKNIMKMPYNLEKAKQLLNDAGWKLNEKTGIREKDGKPFKIDCMIQQGDELRKNISVLIQKSLKDIGVDMQIREREWSALLDALTKTRDNWDTVVVQFGASPDPDHHTIFHSKGGFDLGNYSNPKVDEALDKGRVVLDPKQRKVYYDEYQKIAAEDVATVFLWHSVGVNLLSSRFKGMTNEPAGQAQIIHKVWDTKATGTK